jgi:hypothetical protein
MDPLPSGDSMDEVIAVYMQGVDRTLLRENLKRTPGERLDLLDDLYRFSLELRRAGRKAFPRPVDRVAEEP